MKRKKDIKNKIHRVDAIKQNLEISASLDYSIEDFTDAIITAKIDKIQQNIDDLLTKLSHSTTKKEYDIIYSELEDNEEMLFLLNKKYSKNYMRAKKIKNGR